MRMAADLKHQRELEEGTADTVPTDPGSVVPASSRHHKEKLEAEAVKKRKSLKAEHKDKDKKKRKKTKRRASSPSPRRLEKHRRPPSPDDDNPEVLKLAKKLVRALASK